MILTPLGTPAVCHHYLMSDALHKRLGLEDDGTIPLPEKVTRARGVTLFPPGGLYLRVLMIYVGAALDIVQAKTLFSHGKPWFALSLVPFILLSCLVGFAVGVALPGGFRGLIGISVHGGILENQGLYLVFAVNAAYSSAFKSFLAPYGMILTPELTLLQGANAGLALVLSIKSLGQFLMEAHLGPKMQCGEAVVKRQPRGGSKLTLLKMYVTLHAASVLATTVVFTRVYHPLVSLLLFLPVAKTTPMGVCGSFCAPMALLGPFFSSVFGLSNADQKLLKEHGKDNPPATKYALAHFFRLIAMIVLLFLDFPSTPLRPMGKTIFMEDFVGPISDSTVGLWKLQQDGELSLNSALGELTGLAILRYILLLLIIFGVPVQVLGTLGLLAANDSFRTGRVPDDTYEEQKSLWSECYEILFKSYKDYVGAHKIEDPHGVLDKLIRSNECLHGDV